MKTQSALLILTFLCFCTFSSCKGRKDLGSKTNIIELEIRELFKQKEMPLSLSSITEEVTYVPLETNDSCVLHGVYRLMLTNNYILVSDGSVLYQFDLSGKFIRQIGRYGRGPGEHGRRIKVDIQNGNVFIFSSGIMNIYDFETGIFKQNFEVDFDVSDFVVTPEENILFFTFDLPVDLLLFTENEIYITNNEGEIIKTISNNSRLNNRTQSQGYVNIYRKNDEIKYMYNFRDTLYSIAKDFRRKPGLVFKFENLLDRDKIVVNLMDNVHSDTSDFIWISRILESKNYMFFSAQKGIIVEQPEVSNILYDISSKNLFRTSNFINDIDGGMPFWPQFSSENILIDHHQSYLIIDYYKSTLDSVDHSGNFIKLVESLDEGDNPVLVFIKL